MEAERCSIVVVLRDRFSTTARCLEAVLANTPEPFDLTVVLGNAPAKVREDLTRKFGAKARFIFGPKLLNPSESRNVGLREARTRLAVLMDNDVFVRPNWLGPMIRCQKETGAAMVVPVVLEGEQTIHTAGNDLLVTYKDGVAYGQKVLRYCKQVLYERSNLKRQPVDYGELHCQLVDVQTALRLEVYDERLREVGEVGSGLAWAKGGCSMWFEPESVVRYDFPERITKVEDVRPYIFKWDMGAILDGYNHFRRKWDLDITECGNWKEFNVIFNDKLGLLSRIWPSPVTLFIDNLYYRLRKILGEPVRLWRNFKAWTFGYYKWQDF